MSYVQSEFPADLLAGEPSVEPLVRQRSSRRLTRFMITFGFGVGATLAWQSYGDMARALLAYSYPQLGWLAPQPAAAHTAQDTTVPPTSLTDPQELKAMSLGLAVVRQRVDQLAAQVAAGQDQITRDFTTKLQAAEQDILNKISAPPPRPEAAVARKPPLPQAAAPAR